MRLLFTLLLLPALVGAQTQRDSIISINSSRFVRLVPDRATLFVTIEGTAETARDALARGEIKLGAVMTGLRALGEGVDVGTPVAFSVAPTPGARGYPGAPATSTITARTTVRVQVSRMPLLASVFAAASDAGASSVTALSYESSKVDSARRAEVAVALATARQEADAIAAALGGRIGGVVDVSTSGQDRVYQQQSILPLDGMSNQPNYAPEVTLSINATARFRLIR